MTGGPPPRRSEAARGLADGLIGGALARPIAVGAFCTALALLALAVGLGLPVTLLPPIVPPTLYVWTAAPDGDPAQTEATVTVPVERAVADAGGVRRVDSWSRADGSLVRLTFSWRTRMDAAAVEVRQLVGQADVEAAGARPVLLATDPGARPLLLLALLPPPAERAPDGAEAGDLAALQRVAESTVAPRIERAEGVGRVATVGGSRPRVRVVADPARLRQAGLDVGAVERALGAGNVTVPGGRLRQGAQVYAVELSGDVASAEAVRRLPLGPSLRLADVARVDEEAEALGEARYAGRPALLLAVQAQADANAVRAARAARAELDALRAEAPGLDIRVVDDQSAEIRAAVSGVGQALALGGVLVALVLALTLRAGRLVLPTLVALPLSLAGAVALFALAGLGLNLLTLSGLALAIGMLVDNALVVTESIARQAEAGRPADDAALDGTQEVAGPIIAGTLTTVAVFVPVAFVDGLAGRLFQDQALAAALALGVSLLVALTVVPLLARRGLRQTRRGRTDAGPAWLGRAFHAYEGGLRRVLARPALALGAGAVLLAAGLLAARALPRELLPVPETARAEAVLTAPPGADGPALGRLMADAEAALAPGPGAGAPDTGAPDALLLRGGPDAAPLGLGLLGTGQVFLSADAPDAARLAEVTRAHGATLALRPARSAVARLLGQDEHDLDVDVRSERLRRDVPAARALVDALAAVAAVRNVDAEALALLPAYTLDVDAAAAARYGVGRAEVGALVEAAVRGRDAAALASTSENVPVRVRVGDEPTLAAVLEQRVPRPDGPPVPLRLLVRPSAAPVPSVLVRADLQPVLRATADLAPGARLPETLAGLRAAARPHLRAEDDLRVRGLAEAFQESLRQAGLALLLSVGLVYLLLAAQFESLRLPLVVLAVVPLSLGGVALTLWLTGHTLNVMSLTGAVVLTGIVVNDAILKVSFAERARAGGRALHAAVREAGRARFRPILMTTVTTVLGLLPVALQRGDAAVQAPLAVAVIGGLVVSTALALFVVPVLYVGLAAPVRRRPVRRAAPPAAAPV